MGQAFKTVIKIIALLVGILMLFGGGLCVATDVVMMVAAGGREFMLWLGLLGIACLVAVVGWALVKFGGGFKDKSPKHDQHTDLPTEDSHKNQKQ